jgi:serine protease Do
MLSDVTDAAAKADLNAGGITGFSIYRVLPGSAGERAGLRPGDIVYMIDGSLIVSRGDLERVMNRLRPGETVWLCVLKVNDQSNYWTAQDIKISF